MASISQKVTFEEISKEAEIVSLKILGGFHPTSKDKLPKKYQTLLLLGPDEPHFWHQFKLSPEMQDRQNDPMDRWSVRVIGELAEKMHADPVFPFSGPPYAPFFQWAVQSGRAHISPIKLLVHNEAGLFVSFRGALAFEHKIELPPPLPSPCSECSAPCRSACPVAAFDGESYDAHSCRAHVSTIDSKGCLKNGCAARRACPLSKLLERAPEQSAFHMRAFLPGTS